MKTSPVIHLMPETLVTLENGVGQVVAIDRRIEAALAKQPEIAGCVSEQSLELYRSQSKLLASTHALLAKACEQMAKVHVDSQAAGAVGGE